LTAPLLYLNNANLSSIIRICLICLVRTIISRLEMIKAAHQNIQRFGLSNPAVCCCSCPRYGDIHATTVWVNGNPSIRN
jgi:hypothetical protein